MYTECANELPILSRTPEHLMDNYASFSLSLLLCLLFLLLSAAQSVSLSFPLSHLLAVISTTCSSRLSQLAPSVRTPPLLPLLCRSSSVCGCKQDKWGNIGDGQKAKGNKSRARAQRAKRLSGNQCCFYIKLTSALLFGRWPPGWPVSNTGLCNRWL